MFDKNLILLAINKKGWSKYKLCKEANLAQSTLSDILSGKNSNPRMDTIQKIADALELSVNSFFTDLKETPSLIDKTKKNGDEDFNDEIRAIARDMKNLSSDKRDLLKQLIKTMSEAGDDELNK